MAQSPATQFCGIFVSYRRDHSAGHAGRLFDNLVDHFGKDRIFMDIDTVEPGEDFVTVIENAVGSCGILIAVMGQDWLSSSDGTSRRLDNPNDFVRVEIATALKRKIRVIPVLVQKATMPRLQDLPDEIADFSRRNAIELSDQRWQYDIDRLIAVIEKVLAKQALPGSQAIRDIVVEPLLRQDRSKRIMLLVIIAAVVVLAVVVLVWIKQKPTAEQQPANHTATFPSTNQPVQNTSTATPPDPAGQKTPTPKLELSASEYTLLGDALYRQGRFAEAETYYTKAYNLQPHNADRNTDLGNALYSQRKYADAEPYFEKAMHLSPDTAYMHDNLGLALFYQQKYSEAGTQFKEAVRLAPGNAEFKSHLTLKPISTPTPEE